VTAKFSHGQISVDVNFVHPLSDADVAAKVASLPGIVRVEQLDSRRLRLYTPGGPEEEAKILRGLISAGLDVVSFQESKSALEEVYLSQISRGD
jgi:hypothetical protein